MAVAGPRFFQSFSVPRQFADLILDLTRPLRHNWGSGAFPIPSTTNFMFKLHFRSATSPLHSRRQRSRPARRSKHANAREIFS